MSDRDGRIDIINESITFEFDNKRSQHVLKVGSAKITSTLNGNIASQNKQRFSEYKKWSDASAINEFVIVTLKTRQAILMYQFIACYSTENRKWKCVLTKEVVNIGLK